MRRFLQILTGIEAAIAILAGGITLVHGGPGALHLTGNHHFDGTTDAELAAIDFAMRAGAALLVVLGVAFATLIPGVEKHTVPYRFACAGVLAMALGRLASVLTYGAPNGGEWLAIGLELALPVAMVVMQTRLARNEASRRDDRGSAGAA